jgi:hypothetical protein
VARSFLRLFPPDGQLFASSSSDNTTLGPSLCLWDLASGSCKHTLEGHVFRSSKPVHGPSALRPVLGLQPPPNPSQTSRLLPFTCPFPLQPAPLRPNSTPSPVTNSFQPARKRNQRGSGPSPPCSAPHPPPHPSLPRLLANARLLRRQLCDFDRMHTTNSILSAYTLDPLRVEGGNTFDPLWESGSRV